METLVLGESKIRVDVERTRATYALIDSGNWSKCGCAYCMNFGAVALKAFPPEVLAFFERAGIDPLKDAEVYEFGESRPGFHSYGGEFYMWGEEVNAALGDIRADPTFKFTFMPPSPLAQNEFRGSGALCFLFEAELPWADNSGAT